MNYGGKSNIYYCIRACIFTFCLVMAVKSCTFAYENPIKERK